MRRTALVSLAVAALAVAPVAVPSASAATGGAVAFTGTAYLDCFGCGYSHGTADLSVIGLVGGNVVDGPAYADYTMVQPNISPFCMISGSASGYVTGTVNVTFNWTRVGALALIGTTGDITGLGFATFTVTSPTGVPCGGPVVAQFEGTVAGT